MEFAVIVAMLLGFSTGYFFLVWQRAMKSQIKAQTQLEDLYKLLHEVEAVRDSVLHEKQEEVDARIEAQTQMRLAQQELESIQKEIVRKQRDMEEAMQKAELVMLKKGREGFKEEAEQFSKKTMEAFQDVVKNVAALHDRVEKNDSVVETVWRSLSTPAAAGHFSEFGLENTFKNYGLESGRDFIMQYTVDGEDGSGLRPDAVVFLPAGNVLVVDSKASKFFLELADANDEEQKKKLQDKLVKRMHEHLKSLASKGYKDAVKEFHRKANKQGNIGHILTVMFVQSEAGIETLCQADSDFRQKCTEKDIILSGPAGLAGLMSTARYSISTQRQENNNAEIINELSILLGNIEVILGHALKVGKGLESAAKHYGNLTKSVNQRLLPKARKMLDLGIEMPKSKKLPGNLPSYDVITHTTIEGESEELQEVEIHELENIANRKAG